MWKQSNEQPVELYFDILSLPRWTVSRAVFRVKICAEHDAAKIKFKKVEEKIEKCEFLKIVVFFLVKTIIGVVST